MEFAKTIDDTLEECATEMFSDAVDRLFPHDERWDEHDERRWLDRGRIEGQPGDWNNLSASSLLAVEEHRVLCIEFENGTPGRNPLKYHDLVSFCDDPDWDCVEKAFEDTAFTLIR